MIKINGTEVTISKDSLSINYNIGERSTANFEVILTNSLNNYYKGQQVEIYDEDNLLVYTGIIEESNKSIHKGAGYVSIDITDFCCIADRKTIVKVYEDEYAGTIVADILTNYLSIEGVTVGEIQQGPLVKEAVFNYIYVSDALDKLSELTTCWWNIDKNMKLYFVEKSTFIAPWTVTKTDMLENSVSVKHNSQKYRNKQYIHGGQDETNEQTEYKTGDGENRTFTLGYKIVKKPVVEVDNGSGYITQTVGVRGIDNSKQFYWTEGDNTIIQDEDETVLAETDKLRIKYYGLYDMVVVTYDQAAMEDRKTVEGFGTGVVEHINDESIIMNRETSFQEASQLLMKYGKIGRTIQFTTPKSGLEAGQILNVDRPDYDLNNVEMLIESISINKTHNELQYTIKASEYGNNESWSNYFNNISTSGQPFVIWENIKKGEKLIILEQFSKNWESSDNPNMFIETYADDDLFSDDALYPMISYTDRIKYVELLDNSNTVLLRKQITRVYNEETEKVLSTFFVSGYEGNGDIAKVRWFGGKFATEEFGSGIMIDEQMYSKEKTDLETLQIDKTDNRNFIPATGTFKISEDYMTTLDNLTASYLANSNTSYVFEQILAYVLNNIMHDWEDTDNDGRADYWSGNYTDPKFINNVQYNTVPNAWGSLRTAIADANLDSSKVVEFGMFVRATATTIRLNFNFNENGNQKQIVKDTTIVNGFEWLQNKVDLSAYPGVLDDFDLLLMDTRSFRNEHQFVYPYIYQQDYFTSKQFQSLVRQYAITQGKVPDGSITREDIRENLIGDESAYLNNNIIPNKTTSRKTVGRFASLVTTAQSIGSRNGYGTHGFAFGVLNGNWYFQYGGDTRSSIVADTEQHEFEITTDGEFKVDGNIIYTIPNQPMDGATCSVYMLALNNSHSVTQLSSFIMYTDEITHEGVTYKYNAKDFDESTGQLPNDQGGYAQAYNYISDDILNLDYIKAPTVVSFENVISTMKDLEVVDGDVDNWIKVNVDSSSFLKGIQTYIGNDVYSRYTWNIDLSLIDLTKNIVVSLACKSTSVNVYLEVTVITTGHNHSSKFHTGSNRFEYLPVIIDLSQYTGITAIEVRAGIDGRYSGWDEISFRHAGFYQQNLLTEVLTGKQFANVVKGFIDNHYTTPLCSIPLSDIRQYLVCDGILYASNAMGLADDFYDIEWTGSFDVSKEYNNILDTRTAGSQTYVITSNYATLYGVSEYYRDDILISSNVIDDKFHKYRVNNKRFLGSALVVLNNFSITDPCDGSIQYLKVYKHSTGELLHYWEFFNVSDTGIIIDKVGINNLQLYNYVLDNVKGADYIGERTVYVFENLYTKMVDENTDGISDNMTSNYRIETFAFNAGLQGITANSQNAWTNHEFNLSSFDITKPLFFIGYMDANSALNQYRLNVMADDGGYIYLHHSGSGKEYLSAEMNLPNYTNITKIYVNARDRRSADWTEVLYGHITLYQQDYFTLKQLHSIVVDYINAHGEVPDGAIPFEDIVEGFQGDGTAYATADIELNGVYDLKFHYRAGSVGYGGSQFWADFRTNGGTGYTFLPDSQNIYATTGTKTPTRIEDTETYQLITITGMTIISTIIKFFANNLGLMSDFAIYETGTENLIESWDFSKISEIGIVPSYSGTRDAQFYNYIAEELRNARYIGQATGYKFNNLVNVMRDTDLDGVADEWFTWEPTVSFIGSVQYITVDNGYAGITCHLNMSKIDVSKKLYWLLNTLNSSTNVWLRISIDHDGGTSYITQNIGSGLVLVADLSSYVNISDIEVLVQDPRLSDWDEIQFSHSCVYQQEMFTAGQLESIFKGYIAAHDTPMNETIHPRYIIEGFQGDGTAHVNVEGLKITVAKTYYKMKFKLYYDTLTANHETFIGQEFCYKFRKHSVGSLQLLYSEDGTSWTGFPTILSSMQLNTMYEIELLLSNNNLIVNVNGVEKLNTPCIQFGGNSYPFNIGSHNNEFDITYNFITDFELYDDTGLVNQYLGKNINPSIGVWSDSVNGVGGTLVNYLEEDIKGARYFGKG